MQKRYEKCFRLTNVVPEALDILYPCLKTSIDNHATISFKNVLKSSFAVFLFEDEKSADKRVQSVDAKGWSKTFTSFN